MNRHGGLAIPERRELLPASDGDGGVAKNDLLGESTHRLQTKRQRNDIQQEPILAFGAIARQDVGLNRGAQCNDLIRIEIVQWRLSEKLRNRLLYLRHPRRAADHHDALDLGRIEPGITQRLPHWPECLADEGLGDRREGIDGQRETEGFARR